MSRRIYTLKTALQWASSSTSIHPSWPRKPTAQEQGRTTLKQYLPAVLLKVPLAIVQRAHLSGLEPSRNAMEVECVLCGVYRRGASTHNVGRQLGETLNQSPHKRHTTLLDGTIRRTRDERVCSFERVCSLTCGTVYGCNGGSTKAGESARTLSCDALPQHDSRCRHPMPRCTPPPMRSLGWPDTRCTDP